MCLTAFKAVMEMGQWEGQEEENNNERKLIRRPPPTDLDKWNSLPEVPTRTEIGYLHLSFEYHRGALRVRVWQISDLLLPPPQISMIHSIFVRGYFLPDKVKKTNRRTEEVLVEVPDKNGVATANTGVQHIFTPSSFKFQTPLMYTGLTLAIIRERSIQLEVCMTQKNTHRVFLMAMVHMPLRTALRRPIREKYPLIPCLNLTTPNNMRVYSAAALLPHLTGLKGQERKGGPQANGRVGNGLAGKEMDLEDDVSLSGEDFLRSHLSLCLDEDSEDDSLARSGSSSVMTSQTSNSEGSGASSSSSNTLNNPSSGDDELDDNQYEDAGEYDEDLSDWGDDSARNTPLNGSLCDVSDSSASKKKIIPNELLQDEGGLSDGDLTAEESDAVNGAPERSEEAESDVSASGFASPHATANGFQAMDSSVHSKENGLPPATSTQQDPDNARSSLSGSVRRKIVPAANSDNADREESCIRKDKPSHADPCQAGARDLTPTQKEESAVTAENQSNPAHSPTRSTNHRDSKTQQPPGERVKSDGLAPAAHPPSSSSSSLSPLTDSGFSPASRPETPCWDFYDFSEDLLPEVDLESGGQRLEESLAQLRQHGIGSLQNLSMEPILPMVLVDDFDTLTVEDEKPFAVDDEKPVAVDDEKPVAVEDEKAFTKDDENTATMDDTKAITVDKKILTEDDKKSVTVDMKVLAEDDKKSDIVDTKALTVDEKIVTVDKEKILTVDGEGALTVENERAVTVDDE